MITRNLHLHVFHGDHQALFHDKREGEVPEGLLVVLVDHRGTRLELPLRSWEEVDTFLGQTRVNEGTMEATIPVVIG